jgi:polyhydroxybutyrate depolymerase
MPLPKNAALAAILISSLFSMLACIPKATREASPLKDDDTKAATSNEVLVLGSGERPAQLHRADTAGGSRPLLVVLHGFGMDAASMLDLLHIKSVTADLNAHALVPEGRVNKAGKRFWDATDACCDFDAGSGFGRADEDYLLDLIDQAQKSAAVDRSRIYLVGFSNGSFMAHRLACHHAEIFAGVASFSGANFENPSLCQPSRPLSIIHVHGTRDPIIQYEGGRHKANYPSATATASFWANNAKCQASNKALGAKKLSDYTIDMSQITAPLTPEMLRNAQLEANETDVLDYVGCAEGKHVALWTMNGLGHAPLYRRDVLIQVLGALGF